MVWGKGGPGGGMYIYINWHWTLGNKCYLDRLRVQAALSAVLVFPGNTAGNTDSVVIGNNNTLVTLDVTPTYSIASLTLNGLVAPNYTRVAFSGTNSLTVTGAVTVNAQTGASGGSANYVDVAGGTFSAGSVSLSGNGTSAVRLAQLLIGSGTATITGNLISANSASQLIFSGSGVLNAGGTFMSGFAGTFTASTGTVNFNAAGAQSVPFAYTFNNLTLSGSGAKTINNATINGILSLEGTATATTPTYGAAATLQYNGTGAQTTGPERIEFICWLRRRNYSQYKRECRYTWCCQNC